MITDNAWLIQAKEKGQNVVKKIGVATLFMGGLAFAGSDSVWFPWINIVGILLFIAFGIIANRLLQTAWKNIDRNHLERKKR